MIINIDDTQKLKRVIIEFSDNEDSEVLDLNPKKVAKSDKSKSKSVKNVTENDDSDNSTEGAINFNDYLDKTEISNEVIEKPNIPDIERPPMVSEDMQNLNF